MIFLGPSQIAYGLRSGVASIGKHKAMSLTSVITTAACLLLISIVYLLGYNLQANAAAFQTDNTILAFVDETFSTEDAEAMQSRIEAIEFVEKATFISREEAMDTYIEEYGDDSITTSRLSPSVFRDRYSVEVNKHGEIKQVATNLEAIDGIDGIRMDEKVSEGFAAIQRVVWIVGVALGLMLFLIAVVIMTNTIGLTMLARSEEISVMRMMGAYNSFIRFPFVVEGCIVGCIGALLAYALSSAVYIFVSNMISDTGFLSIAVFVSYAKVAMPLLLLMMALGLSVGVAGSSITIRKYLRENRKPRNVLKKKHRQGR